MFTVAALVALRFRRPRRQSMSRAARLARAPEQPRALELAYTRDLIHLLRPVHDLLRREILPVLGDIARVDAARADVLFGRVANKFRMVRLESTSMLDEDRIVPVIESTAVKLDKFNRRQMVRTLGIDLAGDERIAPLMAAFRRENVALIQSIPAKMLEQVEGVLAEASWNARRVEDIAKDIEERFEVAESRAALIARDQVLKANADLTSERQQAAGITEYDWTTSGDEKVREEHRALDGTRQSWAVAPVAGPNGERGHPGRIFQCRCFPSPVMPGDG